MLFLRIAGINYMTTVSLRELQNPQDFARGVLQIVAHCYDPSATRVSQTRHDGIMLTEIAGQIDQR